MEHFYAYFFYGGLIYAVLSFLLGNILDFLHVDFDVDFDMDMDLDLGDGPFPIKTTTVAVFCIVFGGVGMMQQKLHWPGILVLAVAGGCGFLGAYLIYKFVIAPLYRMQNTSAHTDKEIIGLTAKVITPILENSFGTISYYIHGNTLNGPAREEEGRRVDQGEKVVITQFKDNVYYVRAIGSDEKNT